MFPVLQVNTIQHHPRQILAGIPVMSPKAPYPGRWERIPSIKLPPVFIPFMDDRRREALEWYHEKMLQAESSQDRELFAQCAFPRF
jgi:hypothetical protein